MNVLIYPIRLHIDSEHFKKRIVTLIKQVSESDIILTDEKVYGSLK